MKGMLSKAIENKLFKTFLVKFKKNLLKKRKKKKKDNLTVFEPKHL